jgi:hypothetical protein
MGADWIVGALAVTSTTRKNAAILTESEKPDGFPVGPTLTAHIGMPKLGFGWAYLIIIFSGIHDA